MGTRNLTIVQLNGKYKVAQYGQWDGYPSVQGKTVLEFLKNADMDKFRSQVSKTNSITSEEVQARWKSLGADESGFVNMEVSNRFKKDYPHLGRDMGADILEYVLNAETPEIFSRIDFAGDSLFCEWAYLIDLDKNTLEVYKGFNKKPIKRGRFAKAPVDVGSAYFPIKLSKKYSLNNLPTLEKFVEDNTDD